MRSTLLLLLCSLGFAEDQDVAKITLSTSANAFSLTPVSLTVAADLVVVPVTVICGEEDLARNIQLKQAAIKKVLELVNKSEQYRAQLAGSDVTLGQASSSFFSTGRAIPEAQIWVTAKDIQNAKATEIAVRRMVQGVTVDKCQIAAQECRLAVVDSERYRPELIAGLSRFVEQNRAALPKESRGSITGLEHPVVVWDSTDPTKVVVTIPFALTYVEK